MLLPVELTSMIVILLIVFMEKGNNRPLKFKRLRIAILIWVLIQILLIGTGVVLLIFVPAIEKLPLFKGEGGMSTYAVIIFYPAIIISTFSAVFFSQRILRKKLSNVKTNVINK